MACQVWSLRDLVGSRADRGLCPEGAGRRGALVDLRAGGRSCSFGRWRSGDAVTEPLDAHKDAFVSHSNPQGGLFIWVRLPEDVDPARLLELANERGVRFGTGKAFDSQGRDLNYVRLAYGWASHEDIAKGIPLLATCVADARTLAVEAR